jgi:aminoglycoside phosphotransferase (APT) family kinase protein
MALPTDALAWIEERSGGRIVDIEQQVRWRPHHFMTIELPNGSTREVLARSARTQPAASAFQKHFDIAHEARVLEAIQGRGLKVPEFLGYNAPHRIILMQRLRGTNDLSGAPTATQRQVMREYIEELARVHSLDVSSMELPGIEIPETAEEIAFAGKFAFQEEQYASTRPGLRPEPLLELGIWWLHANVPRGDRRVSFVQGDTGPGQFMYDDGHLTGLIDWELAHVADPMLDLGVARMRNMLYPTGSLREPFAHYEEVTGKPIDWDALTFFTVLSMLLTPMGVNLTMQKPSATIEGMLPRYGWDSTLRRGFCDALAEALAVDIEAPDLPEAPQSEFPELVDYLTEQLEVNCAPLLTDPAGAYAMNSAIGIAQTLQLESRIGATFLDDDLDDMGAVLGTRPRDRLDGYAKLSKLVADDPERSLVELVQMFARIERRREHLLKPMMIAQSSDEFERLVPRRS